MCRTVDPEIWFPEGPSSGYVAKKMCYRCPVILECFIYAMENREMFGVWGGLSTNQRIKLRRKWLQFPDDHPIDYLEELSSMVELEGVDV